MAAIGGVVTKGVLDGHGSPVLILPCKDTDRRNSNGWVDLIFSTHVLFFLFIGGLDTTCRSCTFRRKPARISSILASRAATVWWSM